MQVLLEAPEELRPLLRKPHDCLRDLLFLVIALDFMVGTALERGYEELNNDGPQVSPVCGTCIYIFSISHIFSTLVSLPFACWCLDSVFGSWQLVIYALK